MITIEDKISILTSFVGILTSFVGILIVWNIWYMVKILELQRGSK